MGMKFKKPGFKVIKVLYINITKKKSLKNKTSVINRFLYDNFNGNT